jgi:hypothetical protein
MFVPRIIHQTAESFDALPDDLKANAENLKRLNPGWDYRFYDAEARAAYFRSRLKPQFIDLIERVNPNYGVVFADIFRHLVMFWEGGVYLDMKSTIDRPIEDIVQPKDHFLLSQWANGEGEEFEGWGIHDDVAHIPGGEYQQWYLIGRPQHPFELAMLKRLFDNMARYDAERDGTGFYGTLRLAGPICYALAVHPLLDKVPYRRIDSIASGIRFTVYPKDEHLVRNPGHYSVLDEPLMLPRAKS